VLGGAKRVLVTGAGGFIGSHLVEMLVEQGNNVRALVHYNSRNDWGLLEQVPPRIREDVEVVAGDIRDAHQMERVVRGCTVVYHLAALIGIPYSYAAPSSYVSTNVVGTLNVLQAAMAEGVERIVHTSTSEVYGTAQYTPIDEKHPLRGQSPYSASKIGADKMAESFHLSFGLPVVTVRPFNTFGPRQSARAVIPTIISQAIKGEEIRLGSLDPVRDLTFVEDTVDGFVRAAGADAAVGRVINLGQGEGVTIGDLAERILTLMGVDIPIVTKTERTRPPRSEVRELVCANEQARSVLGWSPSSTLADGLRRTVAWISVNIEAFKKDYTI